MEISIIANDAADYLENATKAIWRSFVKKITLPYSLILVFSLILLISGIGKRYDNKITTSEYVENGSKVISTTKLYNFHVFFGLGIAFILFFFYLLLQTYKQKKLLLQAANRKADYHKRTNNNFIIKITDSRVYYEDFELTREEKWSMFLNYTVTNEYLFLLRDHYLITSFPVPLKRLTQNELTDLLNFLKTKLPRKG